MKPANPLIHGEVVVVVGQEAVFFLWVDYHPSFENPKTYSWFRTFRMMITCGPKLTDPGRPQILWLDFGLNSFLMRMVDAVDAT